MESKLQGLFDSLANPYEWTCVTNPFESTVHAAQTAFYQQSAAPSRGEVANVIGAMKNAISVQGWTQGVLYSPVGGVCMQGAFFFRDGVLLASRYAHDHLSPLGTAVASTLARTIKESGLQFAAGMEQAEDWALVINFNDYPGRTKEEVLAILQRAWETATDEARSEAGLQNLWVVTGDTMPVPAPDFVPEELLGQLQLELTGS